MYYCGEINKFFFLLLLISPKLHGWETLAYIKNNRCREGHPRTYQGLKKLVCVSCVCVCVLGRGGGSRRVPIANGLCRHKPKIRLGISSLPKFYHRHRHDHDDRGRVYDDSVKRSGNVNASGPYGRSSGNLKICRITHKLTFKALKYVYINHGD